MSLFFRKYDAFFSLPKKCAENYPEKRYFEIVFCLESADSNCTALQYPRAEKFKIQNLG